MKQILTKTKALIPDDQYDALWSGHTLDILFLDEMRVVTLKTIDGVRGIDCPIKVVVVGGDIFEV